MNRNSLELPPLRERLADAWPFAGGFFGLLFGPFFVFPLRKVLMGWLLGTVLYVAIRLLARRPLYDFISSSPEFGMDETGHIHVLNNEKEAFTPLRAWDPKRETRQDVVKVAMIVLIAGVMSAAMVIAANHWDEAVAVSALAGGVIVLSVAEPLQQVRGRRRFKKAEGGVVLDPVVFGPLFGLYVDSDRFDPNDRIPHIDTVLGGALEHLDPAEQAQMLAETKEKIMSRAHAGVAAGSLAKILRLFGG